MVATLRKLVKAEIRSLLEDEALNDDNFGRSCEGRGAWLRDKLT